MPLCVYLEFFFRFVLLLATHWYLLFFFVSCYSCLLCVCLCVYVGYFFSCLFSVCVFLRLDTDIRTHTLSCLSTKKVSHLPGMRCYCYCRYYFASRMLVDWFVAMLYVQCSFKLSVSFYRRYSTSVIVVAVFRTQPQPHFECQTC